MFAFDFQYGGIAEAVNTHHFGGKLSSVPEPYRHLISAIDHMGIGQNDPVLSNDEARSKALGRTLGLRLLLWPKKGRKRIGLTF